MAIPSQDQHPRELVLDAETSPKMSREMKELVVKNAVTRTSGGVEDPSSLLLVPKADGSWRPVLKPLNHFVISPHLKMESVRSVKNLIQPGDWLIKLDLKDAYLEVPIYQPH